MRLSNRSRTPLYSFFYTLVGIVFILAIIVYILEISRFKIFGENSWLLLLVPVGLFILLYIMGRPVFEYDSDGEALNFRNNHILYLLNSKNAKDEFPKYKLKKYNIVNFIFFRRLYIYISSKKNQTVILKYDISFLRSKQVSDLKFSLNKVVKANKDGNTITD